jgi:hypothetical protein
MKIYLKDKMWTLSMLCIAIGFLLLAVALSFYEEFSQGAVIFAAVSASILTVIIIDLFAPPPHHRISLKDFQIFFSIAADFFMSKFRVAESASGISDANLRNT